jgi:hypothetical protein
MRDRGLALGRSDVVAVIDACLSQPSSHREPSR